LSSTKGRNLTALSIARTNVIVEATGLDKAVVGNALHDLWKSDQIEGVLTLGGFKLYLNGIVRVLPGRDRLRGRDGRYKAQP
jgi:hypothetical protein